MMLPIFRNFIKITTWPSVRQVSTQKQGLCAFLTNRAVIQVQGAESKDFLQGLITNDVEHLDDDEESQKSSTSGMFSVLLNTQGRIMFDVIVQKPEDGLYLLDCDKDLASKLVKHLKIYKVRRKIDISVLEESKVFALFNQDQKKLEPSCSTVATVDPRLDSLGCRVIISHVDEEQVLKEKYQLASEVQYRLLRYQLGVCEGSQEIPFGKCFPHETNVDFMHGVSFHKGCYIGQELTARVQHTGVVRKRIMPFVLSDSDGEIPPDTDFLNENGKKIGKLRCIEGQFGLGLMRLAETANATDITLNGLKARVAKPSWWPLEAPKKSPKMLDELE